jgi:hypothetical protein
MFVVVDVACFGSSFACVIGVSFVWAWPYCCCCRFSLGFLRALSSYLIDKVKLLPPFKKIYNMKLILILSHIVVEVHSISFAIAPCHLVFTI